MATQPNTTTPIVETQPQVSTLPTTAESAQFTTQPAIPSAPETAVEAINTIPSPNTTEDVPGYLQKVQDAIYGGESPMDYKSPFTEGSEESNLAKELSPGQRPGLPSFTELFEDIRMEKGVGELEKSLSDLEAQRREAEARLRKRTQTQRDKAGVSLGVIEGRIGQVERQERENIDFINRQIQTKSFQLEIANSLVSTIMNYVGMDYNNAVADYNARLSENIQIYNMVEDKRRFEANLAFQKEQAAEDTRRFNLEFDEKVKRADEAMARANLQIYMDLISNGSMAWGQLSEGEKQKMHKLEVQAGLPMGFVSSMKIPPSAQIKNITTRVDSSGMQWTDILMMNQDGTFTIKSEKMGQVYQQKSSSSSSSSKPSDGYTKAQYNGTLSILAALDKNKTRKLTSQKLNEAIAQVRAKYGLSASVATDVVYAAFEAGGYKRDSIGSVGTSLAQSAKKAAGFGGAW